MSPLSRRRVETNQIRTVAGKCVFCERRETVLLMRSLRLTPRVRFKQNNTNYVLNESAVGSSGKCFNIWHVVSEGKRGHSILWVVDSAKRFMTNGRARQDSVIHGFESLHRNLRSFGVHFVFNRRN